MKTCSVIILGLSVSVVIGTIIPSDRRAVWQDATGIPGGIPNRTTIFANVKNAPYNAVGNDVNDDTAEIQAALDACPSNQVVYIPAGTYKVSASLVIKNGYTVRGDGTNTIIDARGTAGNGIFNFGTNNDYEYVYDNSTAVTVSGPTKDAVTVGMSNTNGVAVGRYLMLDCLNDSNLVSPTGNEGLAAWNSRSSGGRSLRQIVEVTAVAGTNITFTPPLYWWYSNTLSPQAFAFQAQLKYAGIENLKVFANNTGYDKNFQFYAVAYCWLKNIESDYADGDHIHAANSYRCEIRDSYFHDGFSHGPGSTDDCLKLTSGTSAFLIENNIMRRMHVGIMFWGGGGGNVIGYNYMTNQFDDGATTALFSDVVYHGAHPIQMLFEGNVMNCFNGDGVWGTSSHGTVLRNVVSGQNYCNTPFTGRGTEGTTWTKQIAGVRAINLGGFGNNRYFNIVGNRLGIATMGNYPTFTPLYKTVANDVREWDHAGCVLSFGYAGGTDGDGAWDSHDNTDPYTTVLLHGNWDAVNAAQTFDGGIADHVIPDSYYLASKPSWFGSLTYPPIDPSAASGIVTNVPAVYRWLNGTAPSGGSISYSSVLSGTVIQRGTVIVR